MANLKKRLKVKSSSNQDMKSLNTLPENSPKLAPRLQLQTLTQFKGKVVLSKELWYKIFYLHKHCGNTEWSGILFCKTEGSIQDPNSLVFYAVDFYVMDIGSETYTEYDFSEELMDVYTEKPELMGLKICQLH